MAFYIEQKRIKRRELGMIVAISCGRSYPTEPLRYTQTMSFFTRIQLFFAREAHVYPANLPETVLKPCSLPKF